MSIHVYEVLREHHGDKPYQKGDHRELDAMSAHHLVKLGVLVKTDLAVSPPPADPAIAANDEADRQIAAIWDRVQAAGAAAADQIGVLDKRVEEARAKADLEIAGFATKAEKAMQEITERIAAREVELQGLEKRIDAAKAEPPPANKAEGKAPANKADRA